eukprot:ANDGO_02801.mRNA.2 hypothetical protein
MPEHAKTTGFWSPRNVPYQALGQVDPAAYSRTHDMFRTVGDGRKRRTGKLTASPAVGRVEVSIADGGGDASHGLPVQKRIKPPATSSVVSQLKQNENLYADPASSNKEFVDLVKASNARTQLARCGFIPYDGTDLRGSPRPSVAALSSIPKLPKLDLRSVNAPAKKEAPFADMPSLRLATSRKHTGHSSRGLGFGSKRHAEVVSESPDDDQALKWSEHVSNVPLIQSARDVGLLRKRGLDVKDEIAAFQGAMTERNMRVARLVSDGVREAIREAPALFMRKFVSLDTSSYSASEALAKTREKVQTGINEEEAAERSRNRIVMISEFIHCHVDKPSSSWELHTSRRTSVHSESQSEVATVDDVPNTAFLQTQNSGLDVFKHPDLLHSFSQASLGMEAIVSDSPASTTGTPKPPSSAKDNSRSVFPRVDRSVLSLRRQHEEAAIMKFRKLLWKLTDQDLLFSPSEFYECVAQQFSDVELLLHSVQRILCELASRFKVSLKELATWLLAERKIPLGLSFSVSAATAPVNPASPSKSSNTPKSSVSSMMHAPPSHSTGMQDSNSGASPRSSIPLHKRIASCAAVDGVEAEIAQWKKEVSIFNGEIDMRKQQKEEEWVFIRDRADNPVF